MEVSQPATGGKAPRRKWLLAAGALALLAALYAGAWHTVASRVEARLLTALAGQDAAGLRVDCRNPETGGFPLSLTLQCAGFAADDVEHGVSTTLGPAEARVSLWSPNRVRSTVAGPVEIRSAKGLLVGEWRTLTSDVGFGLGGMRSLRVEADALKANFMNPARGAAFQAVADRFTGFADGESGDLSAGMVMEGAVLTRNGAQLPLPPLKIDAAITVAGRGDLVGRFDRKALYDTAGDISRFTANLGEGRDVALSGPFSIDGEGRLSGRLKLEAKNVQGWIDAARQAVPEAAPMIDAAAALIRSYTKGSPDLSLDLTLKRGKVLVAGFIPVGELPPL